MIRSEQNSYNDTTYEGSSFRSNGTEKQSQELFPETKSSLESTVDLNQDSGITSVLLYSDYY